LQLNETGAGAPRVFGDEMKDFNYYMDEYQTNWRKHNLKNQECGEQRGKRYPWIIPRELWQEGLWQGIRDGNNSLPAYLKKSNIQKHDGVHNLKSSWMQCANLYFPFRKDRDLLVGFLHEHVSPLIRTVDCVELEWAGNPPFDPTTLLGEPHGQRGKNQTSPDIAFIVNGGKGIVLTENKFTEHSFYACSGRKREYGNPDTQRCLNLDKVRHDIANHCYMLQWACKGRTNRKYWDYIRFSPAGLATLKYCPAATSGYQLFRQQTLAEALAQKNAYEFVISCVAHDERNQTLIECLKGSGIEDFTIGWGPLFEGKATFDTFTHQQWVEWVQDHDSKGRHKNWLEYVRQRYGF